jgi:hypothetical protein
MGARLTIHARVFELVEADPFTHEFMAKNAAVFWRSDPLRVLQAVQADLRLPCQVCTSCLSTCPLLAQCGGLHIVSLHPHVRTQLYQRTHCHQGGCVCGGRVARPSHPLPQPPSRSSPKLHPG